ncbi:MAG TPA: acyltransferase [Ohtaekwangia sp.]
MDQYALKKGIRFEALDSLRGLAAIIVFLFHCALGHSSEIRNVFRFGVTGVDLFFMISGFVILLTLQRTKDWRSFVVGRFAKLYPVYWVIVSFTALLILINQFNEPLPTLLTDYLGNLTMIQRYFGIQNLDEQYWTLEVELLFYMLMLVILLSRKLKSIEIIGSIFLAFAVIYDLYLQIELHPVMRHFLLINHFPLFFAGIMFYKIRMEGGNIWRYILLGCCFVTACMLFNNGGRSMYYLFFRDYIAVLVTYFIVFALAVYDRIKFITLKPFLFMGRISYSFYLIHQYISVQIIIPRLQQYMNFYLAVFIALVVCVGLATLTSLYIEEPSVRFGKRWLSKRTATAKGSI